MQTDPLGLNEDRPSLSSCRNILSLSLLMQTEILCLNADSSSLLMQQKFSVLMQTELLCLNSDRPSLS